MLETKEARKRECRKQESKHVRTQEKSIQPLRIIANNESRMQPSTKQEKQAKTQQTMLANFVNVYS